MKISNEQFLRIIALAGEVSQPELQEKTGLKQNTLSVRISKLRKEGKVKTRKISVVSTVLILFHPRNI